MATKQSQKTADILNRATNQSLEDVAKAEAARSETVKRAQSEIDRAIKAALKENRKEGK